MYLCAIILNVMATTNTKTNYNLHLKGFVGGYDFDADYVDYILSKNSDKEVYVLIDSLGGRSNTALSIFSAFKRHGNVNVHFVGMNASAATIASLGAKHITMDSSAMYLVHKGKAVIKHQCSKRVAGNVASHGFVNLTEGFNDMAVLIELLVRDFGKLVVVLLQHIHSRRLNRGEELGAGLQTLAIDVSVVLALLGHGIEVEKVHITEGKSCVGHKYKTITRALEMARTFQITNLQEFFLIERVALFVAALREFDVLIGVRGYHFQLPQNLGVLLYLLVISMNSVVGLILLATKLGIKGENIGLGEVGKGFEDA